MAAVTGVRSVHATLTGITVDTVTLTGARSPIEVVNRDTTNAIWVTYMADGTAGATPVAAGAETTYIGPGGSLFLSPSLAGSFILKILGNGGAYSVESGPVQGRSRTRGVGLQVAAGGGGGPATLASGAVASGAYSAGSIAAGAYVAGSVLSGALAAGAIVDLSTLVANLAVASGAADAGNPVKVGGQARLTNPTAVTDGQRVNLITDKLGKLVAVPSLRDLDVEQVTIITASTVETTILTAGAAGVFHDVYALTLTNTSATGTEVTIRDVTAGGTAKAFYVPATTTVGISLTKPLRQATAASAWTATCVTSVSSVKVTIAATKNL